MSVMSSGEHGRPHGPRRSSFGPHITGMRSGGVESSSPMGGCGRDSSGGGVGVYSLLEGREAGDGHLVVV